MDRNESRDSRTLSNEQYSSFLNERGYKSLTHFACKEYKYPTPLEILELTLIPIIWKFGEKFYKLASVHYGDPTLWHVIAFYNKRPTDAHVKEGETIYVPMPFEKMIRIMEKR